MCASLSVRRFGAVSTRRARTVAVFSEAAATYNSVGPPFFSDFARKLVEFADMGGDEDILDVATGTGAVLLEAVGHLRSETRVVGVDLTEAMLARAAAELARRGLRGIDLQLMDAESLSFGDSSFDLVFCAFAFSSFPNKPQAIREFVRVLRPGRGFVFWIPPIGTSTTTRVGHGIASCSKRSRSEGLKETSLLTRASYPISSWLTISATSSSLKRRTS
jgi:ubiquinone/menaquinone biosynthesis C-methylase UbiE